MIDYLQEEFKKLYQKPAENFWFCPGRVNLIGEHIDYNGGWVLPSAVSFGSYMATASNDDGVFRLISLNFDETFVIPLQNGYEKSGDRWYNYPIGVIDHFTRAGHRLKGLDILFYGDIPIGSGLSSSASIEVATAFMLNTLFNGGYSTLDLVKISQNVENNFVGVSCGIMDQYAVAFGEADRALLLNCENLDHKQVVCDLGDYFLAVIKSNKARKLAESKYNERVEECKMALEILRQKMDLENLCGIGAKEFQQFNYLFSSKTIFNRARHVIEENERVIEASNALAEHDLAKFGKLMYASHNSLQNLYEVSGQELDTIVAYCKTDENVLGARMTGAGFGGCAIALVRKNHLAKFTEQVTAFYTEKIGYAPTVYSSTIGNGVRQISDLFDTFY